MTTGRMNSGATDVLLGLVLAVAGLLLLGGTFLKVIPSVGTWGAFVLVAGLIALAGALLSRTSPGFMGAAVSGALLTVLGAFVLRYPETPVSTIQVLAGALFAVNGIVRLASVTEYPAHRTIAIAGGAASLALAAAVFTDAVKPTMLSLGVLVGVELIVDGLSSLLIGRRQPAGRR